MTEREARELGSSRRCGPSGSSSAPTPGDVAARADILSVHLALGPDTKGLVNAGVLDRLKPGAMFINTARGEVVDHAALAAAVREKALRVGLDVFANEPARPTGDFSDELVSLPDVYGTHHIGASTDQAQEAIAAETVGSSAATRRPAGCRTS